MAEYNADTPTVLVEAADAQREWCKQVHPDMGQFNVLPEALENAWRAIAADLIARHLHESQISIWGHLKSSDPPPPLSPLRLVIAAQGVRDGTVISPSISQGFVNGIFHGVAPSYRHWGGLGFEEEEATAVYMAAMAARGAQTAVVGAGVHGLTLEVVLRCVDSLTPQDLMEPSGPAAVALWKLYPWEWLARETLGGALSDPARPPLVQAYEPAWKLVMSSKAMLAYLWAKYPGHPNLLPSAMADDVEALGRDAAVGLHAKDYVSKPVLGREGHGLLYGDEATAGAEADLGTFAASVAANDHTPTTLARVPPPVEMPTAADGVEAVGKVRQQLEHRAHGAATTLSQLLDRPKLTTRAAEQDKTVEVHVGPNVLQRYYALPEMMGRKVVTSCWVVRGLPVAAAFREDTERTTNNNSCFVPHYVEREAPPSRPSMAQTPRPPDTPSQVGGEGERDACCPHRELRTSPNQLRLRSDLYGTGGVASADLASTGRASADAAEREAGGGRGATGRCYGAGGYAGRGYAGTGGGGGTAGGYHGQSRAESSGPHGRGGGHGGGGHGGGSWFWPGGSARDVSRASGDAAAKAAARAAEKTRKASGVTARRESARAAASAKHRAAGMNVSPKARKAGSMGRTPGYAHSPPGSTGHASSGSGGG